MITDFTLSSLRELTLGDQVKLLKVSLFWGYFMRELGQVIRIDGEWAILKVAKSTRCAGCTACEMFDDGKPREIVARNDISAESGDMVEIEINPKRVVGHSFLIFIFPIIFMILGYVFGASLSNQLKMDGETSGIIGALTFLGLSFLLIFIFEKRFTKKDHSSARLVAIKN